MSLYYTSPDRTVGAEWAKESIEVTYFSHQTQSNYETLRNCLSLNAKFQEPLFSDTKSYLDEPDEAADSFESRINPNGSKTSLISGAAINDSPEKSPKGNR